MCTHLQALGVEGNREVMVEKEDRGRRGTGAESLVFRLPQSQGALGEANLLEEENRGGFYFSLDKQMGKTKSNKKATNTQS